MVQKKVIYHEFTHEHRVHVVDYLYEQHAWEPVFMCGHNDESMERRAGDKYKDCVFQDTMELRMAQFDYSKIGPPVPIDAEIIGSLAKYESNCLSQLQDTTGWNYSFFERRSFYYDILKYWNTVIHCLNPDLFVSYGWPHTPSCYTLYLLCKHYYSIDVLFIDPIPHLEDDYHAIGFTVEELGAPFKDKYFSDDDELNSVTKQYLSQLKSEKPLAPRFIREYYARIEPQESFQYKGLLLLICLTLLGRGRDSKIVYKKNKLPYDSLKSKMNSFDYFWFNEHKRRKNHKLKKIYGRFTEEPDLTREYLYFAAQYQPEAVTSPHAGVYEDLFLAMDILSASVPGNWVIFYKEHPNIFKGGEHGSLRRDFQYYKKVSSYSNIIMVPFDYSSFDLIDHARAVSTVCGTSGWEAVVREKPALVFGRCWYSACRSIFMIKTLNDACEAIKQIVNGYLPDQKDIARYAEAIYQSSYRRLIDADDFRNKIRKCSNPVHEMERVAKAFYGAYERHYGTQDRNRGGSKMMNKRNEGTFLGVITARGGSRRLPKKNVLDLAGKPLIGWTIEAALRSKYIDELIVSTEDAEIAEISRSHGANVPFTRPQELSADDVHPVDVVIHAVNYFIHELEKEFEYVAFLQPTSPLRNEHDIDEAIEFMFSTKADAVVSVCEADHSPLWYNTLSENLSMKNFLRDDLKGKMSQDLPTYYRLNGAIYICKVKRLLKENTFFLKDNIFAFVMDVKKSVDIDSLVDFKLAEILMQTNKTELLS